MRDIVCVLLVAVLASDFNLSVLGAVPADAKLSSSQVESIESVLFSREKKYLVRHAGSVFTILNEQMPISVDAFEYFWGRGYMKDECPACAICSQPLASAPSQRFQQLRFHNGSHPVDLVWQCPIDHVCCQWKCCRKNSFLDHLFDYGSFVGCLSVLATTVFTCIRLAINGCARLAGKRPIDEPVSPFTTRKQRMSVASQRKRSSAMSIIIETIAELDEEEFGKPAAPVEKPPVGTKPQSIRQVEISVTPEKTEPTRTDEKRNSDASKKSSSSSSSSAGSPATIA